jgi:hypothetical protein
MSKAVDALRTGGSVDWYELALEGCAYFGWTPFFAKVWPEIETLAHQIVSVQMADATARCARQAGEGAT